MSLLYTSLFAFAESTLNRILSLDELLLEDLREHAGTVMALHNTQPRVDCFLVIEDDGERPLRLLQHCELPPDISIRGTLPSLMALMQAGRDELGELPLDIEGDMTRAQAIQRLLSASSIDWRYQLSRVLGDVPAQAVGETVTKGREQARQAAGSLLDDLDEYIHEERQLLPGKPELEIFYLRINQLRLRADRLAARVARLEGHDDKQDPS